MKVVTPFFNQHFMRITYKIFFPLLTGVLFTIGSIFAQTPGDVTGIEIEGQKLILQTESGMVVVEAVADNVVRINYQPTGAADPNTLVVSEENWQNINASIDTSGNPIFYQAGNFSVRIEREPLRFSGSGPAGELFSEPVSGGLSGQGVTLSTSSQQFYGVDNRSNGNLTTNNGANIDAGAQGGGGAPFIWTTDGWGMIADSDGGNISVSGGEIDFQQGDGTGKSDVELFFLFGTPEQIFSGMQVVSGPSRLLPKYSYGFLNTEWGMDEEELRSDVNTYREKDIPLDAYVLDFDWMAWGEDNYGEFRWGNKFPSGPGGTLKDEMEERGVKLLGIRKPRVHTNTVQGNEAEQKELFYDKTVDYFSNKEVGRIDFNKAEAREWYWDTYVEDGAGYEDGLVGYWNDEADEYGGNFMFMQMQRSQYEGQRELFNKRVWSINRNFYLGAQRFSYAMWSGDIGTGFGSMADQRLFMLSSINLGAPWWGMDIGGFNGTPSSENYYRWIQFGAFVPVFRVHGTQFEEREPWNYGSEAEAIAKKYIRLRYKLLPYIYTAAYQTSDSGKPMARPLAFAYPDDPNAANITREWLFGDDLLVHPVVSPGANQVEIYFPEGKWVDFHTGRQFTGPATASYEVSKNEIPIFVKAGATLPTAPVGRFVDDPQNPDVLYLTAFGGGSQNSLLYEDDGATFDYEKNEFAKTNIQHQRSGNLATMLIEAPTGSFQTPERDFIVEEMFTGGVDSVQLDGQSLGELPLDTLLNRSRTGWAIDQSNKRTLIRFPDDGGAHEVKAFFRPDQRPPALDSLTVLSDTTLQVHFNEPVLAGSDDVSAENPANYSIDGDVNVLEATANFSREAVTLKTTAQERGSTHTLTVSQVADRSEQQNVLESASLSYTIPTQYNRILQQGLNGYEGTSDSHIAEFLPVNNMGGNNRFEAGRFDGSNSGDDKSILVRFDMTDAAINDSNLVRAEVVLTMAGTRNGEAEKGLGSFRLLKEWNEGDETNIDGAPASNGEVTWNSARHNVEPWDSEGGDVVAEPSDIVTVGNRTGEEYSWDVTPYVRFWLVNRDENFGILLKEPQPVSENGTKVFFSSENSGRADRPKLVLTFDEETAVTIPEEEESEIPEEFKLQQNYPNPFNPSTIITYQLAESRRVNLTVYNYLGQEVARLVNNQRQAAGVYRQSFDASNLASGVYIYRLQAGSFTTEKKMILVK